MSSAGEPYKILDYFAFGKRLLKTEDLDPVYCMLVRAGKSRKYLLKWCLAFWCYYDVGTSTRIMCNENFYRGMFKAFENKWRRSSDRRHFRTQRSYEALKWLKRQGRPDELVDYWISSETFGEVKEKIKEVPEFGTWAVFKIADMGERVFKKPIDFSDCYEHIDIYKIPKKCAAMIETGDGNAKVDTGKVIRRIEKQYRNFLAPPFYDRPVNIQEVETILCKYDQHARGIYPVGKDIKARTKELKEFIGNPACRRMLKGLKTCGRTR